MGIILSKEILAQLEHELSNTRDCVQVISAFCKLPALQYVEDRLNKSVISKKLLVRFTLSDILSGTTDASLYEFCKEKGWEMFVLFNLHAKTYIFDNKHCIIGSANMTSRGLNISSSANVEISGSFEEIEEEDLKKINALYASAIKVDDKVYSLMLRDMNNANKDNNDTESASWGDDITSMSNGKVEGLFSYEFPVSTISDELRSNQIEFLDISRCPDSMDDMRKAFINTRPYKWLVQILLESDDKELYFGALTAKLHDTLVNDPKPYRKDVKEHLANLLNWVDVLCEDNISIDRPNHSQRVRLIR